MMYVKHFVTCKALCTCVGDCSHYGHYSLTVGGERHPEGLPTGIRVGDIPGEGRSGVFPRLVSEQRPGLGSGESWVWERDPQHWSGPRGSEAALLVRSKSSCCKLSHGKGCPR